MRRKPFSVILFDEVEKAHPRVLDIFLQILSDGRLTDSLGQAVFFSETIIVFTSNIGMRSQRAAGMGASGVIGSMAHCDEMNSYRALMNKGAQWKELRQHFINSVTDYYEREISQPELLNRFGNNIVPFRAVTGKDIVTQIFDGYLKKIKTRFDEVYAFRRLVLDITDGVLPYFADKYEEHVARFGGRAVVNALEDEFLTELARALLALKEEETNIALNAKVTQSQLKIA